jgi:hypothetical protein
MNWFRGPNCSSYISNNWGCSCGIADLFCHQHFSFHYKETTLMAHLVSLNGFRFPFQVKDSEAANIRFQKEQTLAVKRWLKSPFSFLKHPLRWRSNYTISWMAKSTGNDMGFLASKCKIKRSILMGWSCRGCTISYMRGKYQLFRSRWGTAFVDNGNVIIFWKTISFNGRW